MNDMDHKVREAFEQIHANADLKQKTKDALAKRLSNKRRMPVGRVPLTAAFACMAALVLATGIYFSYTTPVAAVSIDVNPSIELQVNLFDRVISVQGYNEEGTKLAESLSVENMNYTEAIDCILENETLLSYQNDGDQVEITVTSNSQNRARRMQDCICKDTAAQEQNVHCLENHEEVEEAHEHGLSFGKYRAFLELQQLDPNITVDDVMDMSMCEIQDLIRGNGGNGSREDGQHNAHGEGHGGRHGSHE